MLLQNRTIKSIFFWEAILSALNIVRKSLAAGLKEPEFIQAEDFKAILYLADPQATMQANMHAIMHVTMQVKQVVAKLFGEGKNCKNN